MTPVHPYPPLLSGSSTVQAVRLSVYPAPVGPHVALNSSPVNNKTRRQSNCKNYKNYKNKKQLSPFMLHGCLAAHVWYFSW